MDQSVAIQETLADGQTCLIISFASVGGGITPLCFACRLFVYTHRRMAITAEDVCLERVVPITEGFAAEEVTPDSDLHIIGSDVTVQISSEDAQLVVRLPFGSHTRMFLQEISRCRPGTTLCHICSSVGHRLAQRVRWLTWRVWGSLVQELWGAMAGMEGMGGDWHRSSVGRWLAGRPWGSLARALWGAGWHRGCGGAWHRRPEGSWLAQKVWEEPGTGALRGDGWHGGRGEAWHKSSVGRWLAQVLGEPGMGTLMGAGWHGGAWHGCSEGCWMAHGRVAQVL
uniref:INPP5B PH domain-containing protein n=1 Tax=Chelonoidis abingdonii TaxID=106734 RepID=A0A8C0H4A0_CHEAB